MSDLVLRQGATPAVHHTMNERGRLPSGNSQGLTEGLINECAVAELETRRVPMPSDAHSDDLDPRAPGPTRLGGYPRTLDRRVGQRLDRRQFAVGHQEAGGVRSHSPYRHGDDSY